jgi:hypothetical protein
VGEVGEGVEKGKWGITNLIYLPSTGDLNWSCNPWHRRHSSEFYEI